MVKRTSTAKSRASAAPKRKTTKVGPATRARKPTKPAATSAPKRKQSSLPKSGAAARTKPKPAPKKTPQRAAKAPRTRAMPQGLGLAPTRGVRRATLWPVHVVTVADVYSGEPGNSPGSAEFAYRFLAEGDSWFTIGGIPSSNLLYEMRFPQQGIVVNIAYPGDTLVHIADLASNNDLKKMLTERFGYRWHAIVLSAGGNDLMDRASAVLQNPGTGSSDPQDYVNAAQLTRFIADVQQGYRTIVALRDSSQSANHGVPVVAHCYDYPTPRNAPARFFSVGLLGPWLYKAFNDKLIDESMWVPVSDFLVNALADAIAALGSGPGALPNFHFVDTRDTLQRAAVGSTGVSGDWLNEIHPSQAGYRKLADKIEATILSLLPG